MNLFLAAAAARFSDGYMGKMTVKVYKVYLRQVQSSTQLSVSIIEVSLNTHLILVCP